MPPCLDTSVVTSLRNRATIDLLLDSYVDRAASRDRRGEQLTMLPLGAATGEIPADVWQWASVQMPGVLRHWARAA